MLMAGSAGTYPRLTMGCETLFKSRVHIDVQPNVCNSHAVRTMQSSALATHQCCEYVCSVVGIARHSITKKTWKAEEAEYVSKRAGAEWGPSPVKQANCAFRISYYCMAG